MLVSHLIKELQDILAKEGDIVVEVPRCEWAEFRPLYAIRLDYPGCYGDRLPEPTLQLRSETYG
jgi:hypothetical protein